MNLSLLAIAAICHTQTGLVPINDLGAGSYLGYQGGLYPGGQNVRPPSHESQGVFESAQVAPRLGNGAPDPNGRIGLLTIGMSNTSQESTAWGQLIAADAQINPKLTFVNGAQGGQTAAIIADEFGAGANFWNVVDQRLTNAGLSRLQVQAIWLKEADANPSSGWPNYANTLRNELYTICRILRKRFANARLCYLSSRIYAGYATTGLNPEPYAYQSAFSVKWLIETQIAGDTGLFYSTASRTMPRPKSSWLSWGPYLWADGTNPRSDGLIWIRSDFAADGTHPSAQGANKVAQMLMSFFKTDATTRGWFLRT